MERIFQGCAVILAGFTVYFLWKGDQADWAFAAGVLACVSFFLSIRYAARHRLGIGARSTPPDSSSADGLNDDERE